MSGRLPGFMLTPHRTALLGLLLIPVWLFREHLLGSALWIGNFDRLNGFLSVQLYLLQSIKSANLVAWDSALFLGVNVLGFAHIFPNPLTLLAALAPMGALYWVAGYISCGLLGIAGIAAYLLVRDCTSRALPAFVGAALFQLSASSILRVSQNDATFAVWIHLPLGLLLLRRLRTSSTGAPLIGLALLLTSLLTFTFLQEAGYALALLFAFAAFRSLIARSPRHVLVLSAALAFAILAASPRILSVASEFGQLNRVAARPFDEVYNAQNVRPREIARWFDNGIFGRFQSEAVALGNNINLSEGVLFHSSSFAAFAVVAGLLRYRGRWFGFLRTLNGDAPFHLLVFLVSLTLVFRPVAAAVHAAALGLEFTHVRAAVATLPGLSVLIALWLDSILPSAPAPEQPSSWRWPGLANAARVGGAVALGLMILTSLTGLTTDVTPARLLASEEPALLLQQNAEILAFGKTSGRPDAPEALTASLLDLNNIQLAWPDVPGETGYRVQMRDGEVVTDIGRVGPNVSEYTISDVTLGRTYTFQIVACNDQVCGDPSPVATLDAPDITPDLPLSTATAPSGFAAHVPAPGVVELVWDDVDGEDRYLVEMRDASTAFREVGSAQADAETYQLGGLISSQMYTFRVRACAAGDCSVYAEPLSVTPTLTGLPVVTPRGLEAQNLGPGHVIVTWADVRAADAYRVEMKAPAAPDFVEIGRAGVSPSAYEVGGLDPAAAYEFRVRACAADRCSDASSVITSAPWTATGAPEAPTDLEAVAAAPGLVSIGWAPSVTADRYIVDMRSGGSPPVVIGETTANQPRYAVGDLGPETAYQFAVRACHGAECSPRSNEIVVTPNGATPSTQAQPPTGLTLTAQAGTTVIAWAAVSGAAEYAVEGRTADGQPFQPIARVNAPTITLSAESVDRLSAVRVRVCDAQGCSFASAPVRFSPYRALLPAPSNARFIVTRQREVSVGWPRVAGADTYQVELRAHDNEEYRLLETVRDDPAQAGATAQAGAKDPVSSLIPADLVSDATSARVRACRNEHCSPPSGPIYLVAEHDWRRLPPPDGVRAHPQGDSALALTWNRVPGAAEYRIELRAQGAPDFAEIARAPGGAVSYTVQPLEPLAVYLVRLRSCADERCSASPVTVTAVMDPALVRTAVPSNRPEATWLRTASLVRVEYAAVVFVLLLGAAALAQRVHGLPSVPLLALVTVMVVEAMSTASLQIDGAHLRTPDAPFVAGDSLVADPGALRLPAPDVLAALHDQLKVDEFRSVLLCDGVHVPSICTQHVSRFWKLRLADGSSMGIPARLRALPWPSEAVSQRVIYFRSGQQLPWGILGLLSVRNAITVDAPFYLNVERADGRQGSAAAIMLNPEPVVPRHFLAAHAVPVADAASAARALFPDGQGLTTPDVQVTSLVEGLKSAETFSTDGAVTVQYGGDQIRVDVTPAAERRFLVLNELYHPGWRAYADGAEIPIYPTNAFMRGIVVEPGVQQITARFVPVGNPARLSPVMIGMTVLLGIVLLLWRARQARRPVGAS